MAVIEIRWESEAERAVVEKLNLDLLLYGEVHLTNARGITRLDPHGVTYTPTGEELSVLPEEPQLTGSPLMSVLRTK